MAEGAAGGKFRGATGAARRARRGCLLVEARFARAERLCRPGRAAAGPGGGGGCSCAACPHGVWRPSCGDGSDQDLGQRLAVSVQAAKMFLGLHAKHDDLQGTGKRGGGYGKTISEKGKKNLVLSRFASQKTDLGACGKAWPSKAAAAVGGRRQCGGGDAPRVSRRADAARDHTPALPPTGRTNKQPL